MGIAFQVLRTDGLARAGLLHTPHGTVETPAFMPVGTQGSVKGLMPDEVAAAGARMILANAYHLWQRPGVPTIAAAGGLHAFMGWRGPILTDSGGFQVFSLGARADADGVSFRSHLDGARLRLTPEEAMTIQAGLGSDIAMALDQCTAYPIGREDAAAAHRRTLAWAERCRTAHAAALRAGGLPNPGQVVFAIVQGSVYRDLRAAAAAALVAMDFPGYAVGSLSVGEPAALMAEVLDATVPLLPAARPRYLMGVGSPDYLIEAVARGIDMADCVLPTRVARNGTALLYPRAGAPGRLVLRNAAHAAEHAPIDARCACPICRRFTRSYIHHLLKAGEMLAPRLLSLHNLHTLHRFVADMRGAILAGEFAAAGCGAARSPEGMLPRSRHPGPCPGCAPRGCGPCGRRPPRPVASRSRVPAALIWRADAGAAGGRVGPARDACGQRRPAPALSRRFRGP
jgi:queuine tRNA-ribosyltransferase